MALAELYQTCLRTPVGDTADTSDRRLSPGGALSTSRLCACTNGDGVVAIWADGPHVSQAFLPWRVLSSDAPHPPKRASRVGAATVLPPTAGARLRTRAAADVDGASCVDNAAQHACEVQSLASVRAASGDAYWIASVDARGSVCMQSYTHSGEQGLAAVLAEPVKIDAVMPSEFGWHGVAPSRDGSNVVVASMWSSALSRTDTHTRTQTGVLHLSGRPCALTRLDGSTASSSEGIVCASIRDRVAVWDVRARECVCVCVDTIAIGAGRVLAMDSAGPYVAAAGSDGASVYIDVRTWRAITRWVVPSKYDVTGVRISAPRQSAYVCGTDQEVLSGSWSTDAAKDAAEDARTRLTGVAVVANRSRRKGGGGGEGRQHAGGFTGTLPASVAAEAHALTHTAKRPRLAQEAMEAEPAALEESGLPDRLKQAYHTGFRGDARWVGFAASLGIGGTDTDVGEDVVLSLSEGGWLYVVRHAERMNMHLDA